MKVKGIFLLAAAALFATGQAFAVPINTSGDNGESTLQQVLNDITVSGPNCPTSSNCQSSVDVHTDQYTPNSYWEIQGAGASVTQIVIRIAGNAGHSTFGVFDAADPTNTYQLFGGGATPTSNGKRTFGIQTDGTIIDGDDNPLGAVFAGNKFGYYLDTPDGIWYSDPALNSDGADHMVAFLGGQGDRIQVGNSAPGDYTSNHFIFGWEDKASPGWDYDYNDFVVLAESISPVPEPTALAMFGLGLLGLGFGLRMSRRRRS